MANLIITVLSIALVAVAALMGAYFGGAAFMNGAAQADANRIIKQADQIQAAWSLHATYNGGFFQKVPLSDLTSQGKYLSQEPKPPEKISTESYSFIKLADNTATDGFDGIQLNLLTTDSARKVCMAIAKTAGSGNSAATPKLILSASDRTPTAGRKFDCLFSGTGATPAVGDPMIFVLNVGAPSVAGGGGGGGGSPTAASLAASPGSLSFTTNTNTASAVQTITISNSGGTDAGNVMVSQTSGISYFNLASNSCGSTLAAGNSCTIGINAKSTASAGSYTGNIAVAYSGGSTVNVSLNVTVSAAATANLVVSPTSLSFTTNTNTASATQNVTLTNSGTASATGVNISLSAGGTYFAADTSNCPASIAPNLSCSITVNAKSTASAGTYTGNIAVTSTNGGSPNVGLSVTVSAVSASVCTSTGAGNSAFNGAYNYVGMDPNGYSYFTNSSGKYIAHIYGYWCMLDSLGSSNCNYSNYDVTTACPQGVWQMNMGGVSPPPTTN